MIFKGVVRDVEDECRVREDDGEVGSIYIGDKDIVSEIKDANFTTNIIVGIADETFSGEHFVETGWGYSEWTPMDDDKLSVGDHDLLEILKRYKGQTITMFVSGEPINILDCELEKYLVRSPMDDEPYYVYDAKGYPPMLITKETPEIEKPQGYCRHCGSAIYNEIPLLFQTISGLDVKEKGYCNICKDLVIAVIMSDKFDALLKEVV